MPSEGWTRRSSLPQKRGKDEAVHRVKTEVCQGVNTHKNNIHIQQNRSITMAARLSSKVLGLRFMQKAIDKEKRVAEADAVQAEVADVSLERSFEVYAPVKAPPRRNCNLSHLHILHLSTSTDRSGGSSRARGIDAWC